MREIVWRSSPPRLMPLLLLLSLGAASCASDSTNSSTTDPDPAADATSADSSSSVDSAPGADTVGGETEDAAPNEDAADDTSSPDGVEPDTDEADGRAGDVDVSDTPEPRDTRPPAICGNGLIEDGEECDDGRSTPAPGDGCDADCLIEDGWTCDGEPSGCSEVCGDGLVVGLEACDDENASIDDGCAECQVEEGWTCEDAELGCLPVCGDGVLVGDEACDDGGAESFDGCSATCAFEEGFECEGLPTVCEPITEFSAGPALGLVAVTGGYNGTIASMACASIEVGASVLTYLDSVELQVAVEHSAVGDIVLKLVAPNDAVLTLVSRPGWEEPADDGQGSAGDSSNLSIDAPIRFADGAEVAAEDMGATIGTQGVICVDDGICEFSPSPGMGPGIALADFVGIDATGTWQVCVGDSFSFADATLDFASLTAIRTVPPEPEL